MPKTVELKFKEDAESVVTSEFHYDLFDGGYIDPENFLEPEDAARVRAAIQLIQQFQDAMEINDLLDYY